MGPWPFLFSLLLLGVVMNNLSKQTLLTGAISTPTKAQAKESTQSWTEASKAEDQNQTKTKIIFCSLYANYLSSLIAVWKAD